MKTWSFSLLLTVVYVAIFNLWPWLPFSGVALSGIAAGCFLLWFFVRAVKQRYFFNRWEALLHLTVIIDILLEAILRIDHESRSFYLCAAAFAAVIVPYRIYLRKQTNMLELVAKIREWPNDQCG